MTKEQYMKQKKETLVDKLIESEGKVSRQAIMINKAKRRETDLTGEINLLRRPGSVKDVKIDPRDTMLKAQENTIKQMAVHIESLIAAGGDLVNGARAIVNLGDNAFQNIVNEINTKG